MRTEAGGASIDAAQTGLSTAGRPAGPRRALGNEGKPNFPSAAGAATRTTPADATEADDTDTVDAPGAGKETFGSDQRAAAAA